MPANTPNETYTINQFIELQAKDEINYNAFSLLERSSSNENVYYMISNIISNYLEDIEDDIKTVSVSELEKIKYIYKPKLLCYDIYGATEVYFILMAINGVYNIKDFDLKDKKFKALSKSTLFDFASKVYNAEEETLLNNRRNLNLI